MPRLNATIKERIIAGTATDNNGCWIWQAYRDGEGYGRISVHGVHRPAHRMSYEQFVGPIPAGLFIDHLCRNRACVNPTHLEPVTNGENVLRGEGVTAVNAKKTECLRGHLLAGPNLYLDKNGHRQCKRCNAIRTQSYKRKIRSRA